MNWKSKFKIILVPVFYLIPLFTYATTNPVDNSRSIVGGGLTGSRRGVSQACLTNGDCNFGDFSVVVANVSEYLMLFTTTVATIMFIYAGFLYITAQGDTNQIKRATNIFRNVLIGFVIILGSTLLVKNALQYIADTNLFRLDNLIKNQ